MRLDVAALEEEVEVAAEVPGPVVAVGLAPALVVLQLGLEGVPDALGDGRRDGQRRGHEDGAAHALWVLDGEQQRGGGRGAMADDHRVGDADRVEHGHGVLSGGARAVLVGALRAVGEAVAARIEGHDAEVARQVGDLELPEARVDDGPRRQEQDRLLAVAEDLVGDADTADIGVAALGRGERPVGRVGGARGDHGYAGVPAARACTASVVRACPPIPQSPLLTSSTTTQVTPRMFSPSISTIVSVSFSIISCFWSSRKTPSMTLTLTSGIAGPPKCSWSFDRPNVML